MSTTIRKLDEIRQDLTNDVTRRGKSLLDFGNKAYLAGLGVIATAQSEGVAAYEKAVKSAEKETDIMVRRGEKLDNKRAVKFESIRADVETRARAVTGRVESTMKSAMTPVMSVASRFGIPSRDEVKALNANVAALSAKVDLLVARLADLPVVTTEPTITVTASEEGWAVTVEGTERPLSVHETKETAVEAARAIATERAPSHLVVYKKDGSVQDKVSYHA
jgi:poly(hydroxyalkanoate) granule-associated protein